MPTYVISAPRGRLSLPQKTLMAASITNTHCEVTAAPAFFAQVIFHEVAAGDYFIGGQPLQDEDQVYLHGHIRSGRDVKTKELLALKLMQAVASAAELAPHCVQVYLAEIPARQIVEYGRLLPLPGDEAAWEQSLSDEVRQRIDRMAT
jgi:phenylpyruvate tautomerase PptA (4-oxalocrotonate tautomerase family)